MKTQNVVLSALMGAVLVCGSLASAQWRDLNQSTAGSQSTEESAQDRIRKQIEERRNSRSRDSKAESKTPAILGDRNLRKQSESGDQPVIRRSDQKVDFSRRSGESKEVKETGQPNSGQFQQGSELIQKLRDSRSGRTDTREKAVGDQDSAPNAGQGLKVERLKVNRGTSDEAGKPDLQSIENQRKKQLESLRDRQREKKSDGDDMVHTPKPRLTLPDRTEGAGENPLERVRKDQREQLRDRLKDRSEDTPVAVKKTPVPLERKELGRTEDREEFKKKLEDLRKGKKSDDLKGTPEVGQKPDSAGQLDRGKLRGKEDLSQRLEELRKAKDDKGLKVDRLKPTPSVVRENVKKAWEQRTEGKRDIRDVVKNLREQQGEKANTAEGKKEFGEQLRELRKIQGKERAELIGANLDEKKLDYLKGRKLLSKEDALTRFGKLDVKPRVELAANDIEELRRGRLPDRVSLPRGDFGRVHRPLHSDINVNINLNLVPPPPPRHGFGVDIASFHWNYWDGRYRYDHSWAINIFVNIGHTRYDGYDGAMVRGRYYCYGWGWMDGCIDYGDRRLWVPGFWAPYNVTECCECEVWVPPVYDWVWTGCCWEQVHVSGGYFDRYPSADCRTVTRYRWVPGHFQYYYS
jgi:hypothetical protein